MILDTSAIVAILKREPDTPRLLDAILSVETGLLISAGSAIELAVVATRMMPPASEDECRTFLRKAAVDIAPVDEEQVRLAWTAFSTYGRGRHPAGLNYGDCFAYALAKQTGRPLLFKGDDFSRTDVSVAAW
jgi:ribonuclease VapC